MKKFQLIILLAVLIALIIPTAVSADSGSGDRVIVGETYTVTSGSSYQGAFIVIGGTLTVEENATVSGDLTLLGGLATISGSLNGDITVIGGHLDLQETAVINGDIKSVGGSVTQDPSASVSGTVDLEKLPEIQGTLESQITTVAGGAESVISTTVVKATQAVKTAQVLEKTMNVEPTKVLEVTPVPPVEPPSKPGSGLLKPVFEFAKAVVSILLNSIFMGVLAMLAALFMPNPLRRITDAINTYPLISEGVGVLTVVALPILLVILIVTLILIPAAVVAIIIFIISMVMGWIALGTELGIRLSKALKINSHIAVSAGLGALLLTLVMNTIWFVPCLGWLLVFLVAMIGLGSVILTRFGTRIYSTLPKSDMDATDQTTVS